MGSAVVLLLAGMLADPTQCEALAKLVLPNTTITSAQWMAAGPFTPPSVLDAASGKRGTILAPGVLGGGNWEGGALDPETGIIYVGSHTSPGVIAMVKDPQRSDMNYVGGPGQVPRVRGRG